MPFVKDQRSLRTSLFFDWGNVFSTSCPSPGGKQPPVAGGGAPYVMDCTSFDFKELRYSVGVGLTWITPLGPLTFSLAEALNPKGKDERQVFQFSLGAPF